MSRKELEKLLESFKIYNYKIDEEEKLHINGNIDLSGMNLEKIPFRITSITGSVQLKGNKIKSFENFPVKALSVVLSYNSIDSFESFPVDSEVDYLLVDNNNIQKFNSFPKNLKSLSVTHNPISSIEGAPMCVLHIEETKIALEDAFIHDICSRSKTWNNEISLLENVKKFIRLSPNSYKLINHTNIFKNNQEYLKLALTSSKLGI